MSMNDTYDELLRGFARHVGLDEEGFTKTQEVVIDGVTVGLSLDGTEDFGDVMYFADVGAPAAHRAADVYKTLLQANYLWAGTGGATIGLHQDTGHVILAGRIDIEGLGAEGLAALLDAFTDTALFWKQFVADELPAGDAENFNLSTRA